MESGVIKDTRKTHSLPSDSREKERKRERKKEGEATYSRASIGLQPDVKWLGDTISSGGRKDRNSI